MPRFILIDHSIEDIGGHHYGYARYVLRAASDLGYTPILATNRRFKAAADFPYRFFPTYTIGFWPRMAKALPSRHLVRWAGAIFRAWRLFRTRLLFSEIGLLWLSRGEPSEYLRRRPFEARPRTTLLWIAGGIASALRTFAHVLWFLIPFRAYFVSTASSIIRFAQQIVRHLWDAVSPAGSWAAWRFARAKRADFANSTARLLRGVAATSGDIVFVPTLAEPEMLGLLDAFQKTPDCSGASFHLLFRRNLYRGREASFAAQDNELLPVRNAFLSFRERLDGQDVRFYTDTEELTRQYNRLGIFPFQTCPIPHTEPPLDDATSEPVRVTYLGDARAEKGYQYFPPLVQNLWRNYAVQGKAKFVIQSNYNVEPGEAQAVVARSLLQAFPADRVELILTACSSERYRELLLSAGVMVLPYDAQQYYARSSGVLIEALCAGIPVVVPSHCWLSKQIGDPVSRYLAGLTNGPVAKVPHGSEWRMSRRTGQPQSAILDWPVRLSGSGRFIETRLRVPPGQRYVVVRAAADWRPGCFAAIVCEQVNEDGSRRLQKEIVSPAYEGYCWAGAMFGIDGAAQIVLRLANAFPDGPVAIREVTLAFVTGPGAGPLPRSAVGVVYREESSASIAEAVREVLDHYDHYRRTAREFASKVYHRHNAAALVEMLGKNVHGRVE